MEPNRPGSEARNPMRCRASGEFSSVFGELTLPSGRRGALPEVSRNAAPIASRQKKRKSGLVTQCASDGR
ncbi:hypothetical protein IWQ54_003980 [Labrenzia sp. EL_195]|nr:hypothetical protein [Labrenzia sp. EL_195]